MPQFLTRTEIRKRVRAIDKEADAIGERLAQEIEKQLNLLALQSTDLQNHCRHPKTTMIKTGWPRYETVNRCVDCDKEFTNA